VTRVHITEMPNLKSSRLSIEPTGPARRTRLCSPRRVTAAPRLIVSAMNQAYNPIASDLLLQDKREELTALTKSMTKWTFSFTSFVRACSSLPSPDPELVRSSFEEAVSALTVMAIGMLFLFSTTCDGNVDPGGLSSARVD
jgi:hypothetical protein